jgi:hypothetical protein
MKISLGESHFVFLKKFSQDISSQDQLEETSLRSVQGYWVIGRRARNHQVYIVFYKNDSALVDVNGTLGSNLYFLL